MRREHLSIKATRRQQIRYLVGLNEMRRVEERERCEELLDELGVNTRHHDGRRLPTRKQLRPPLGQAASESFVHVSLLGPVAKTFSASPQCTLL